MLVVATRSWACSVAFAAGAVTGILRTSVRQKPRADLREGMEEGVNRSVRPPPASQTRLRKQAQSFVDNARKRSTQCARALSRPVGEAEREARRAACKARVAARRTKEEASGGQRGRS